MRAAVSWAAWLILVGLQAWLLWMPPPVNRPGLAVSLYLVTCAGGILLAADTFDTGARSE